MRGKILDVYPKGVLTIYKYLCLDDNNSLFSFPIEHRYHFEILEGIGNPVGKEIEYNGGIEPPVVRFVD